MGIVRVMEGGSSVDTRRDEICNKFNPILNPNTRFLLNFDTYTEYKCNITSDSQELCCAHYRTRSNRSPIESIYPNLPPFEGGEGPCPF